MALRLDPNDPKKIVGFKELPQLSNVLVRPSQLKKRDTEVKADDALGKFRGTSV